MGASYSSLNLTSHERLELENVRRFEKITEKGVFQEFGERDGFELI